MEKRKTVGSLLVEYSKITEADLEEALELQKETGRRLGEVLEEQGKITRQDIEWIISKQLDIPFIIVDESSIDTDLLYALPKDFLLKNRILPMYENDDEIAIVTDDPFNTEAFNVIEQQRGRRVNLSAGDSEAVEGILNKLFRKEGATEMVSVISDITEKLSGTCFYRLDFVGSGEGLSINAFGFGILRNMHSGQMYYSAEDIMKALDALGYNYLYEYHENSSGTGFMMPVHIVTETIISAAYPLINGTFGMGLPGGPVVSGVKAAGLPDLIESDSPIKGYPYIYIKPSAQQVMMAVYTIDSVPAGTGKCHARVSVPSRCPECAGAGCPQCNELGLVFTQVDGVQQYPDIINMLKEDS